MLVIAVIVVIILLTIVIVKLIDKYVSNRVRPFINGGLWIIIGILSYMIVMLFYNEIKFNALKVKRYRVVIDRLIDIRNVQLLYKELNGEYAGNFERLIRFVDTAQIPITQRRDTLVLDEERTRAFHGVKSMKTITITDTLSYYSVKDSLFQGTNRFKRMMYVGVGKENAKFTLKADKIDGVPVFEASVDKSIVLDGEDENMIRNEKQAISIAGVKGPSIKIGSLEEVSTSGNWGKALSNKE